MNNLRISLIMNEHNDEYGNDKSLQNLIRHTEFGEFVYKYGFDSPRDNKFNTTYRNFMVRFNLGMTNEECDKFEILAGELPDIINMLNSKSKVKFINIYSLKYYYYNPKPSKIKLITLDFKSPNKYICYHTPREKTLAYKSIKKLIEELKYDIDDIFNAIDAL
jgi:hypothetical protein